MKEGDWDSAVVVDVGLGACPWTTLELASVCHRCNPDLAIVGVDNDPVRVKTAQRYESEGVRFLEGVFAYPVDGAARLVRAMNLLRQYPDELRDSALAALARPLLPGGLLVEGCTDRTGDTVVARLYRLHQPTVEERRIRLEGILFATSFRRGFAPAMFRSFLARDRLWTQGAGKEFLAAWIRAWEQERADVAVGSSQTDSELFFRSANRLGENLAGTPFGVESDPTGWANGQMIWRANLG